MTILVQARLREPRWVEVRLPKDEVGIFAEKTETFFCIELSFDGAEELRNALDEALPKQKEAV